MDISKRVYQRLRLIGYGTVPDFFCCSTEYRQQINRRTNPCPTPSHLPPLSKGGGLTARHKPLYCCFLLVPCPPFLFTKPFCRQDGGIASPPSLRTTFLPPLVKGEVLSPEKIRAAIGGIVTLTLPCTQPSQNCTIPLAFRGVSATAPLPTKTAHLLTQFFCFSYPGY